MVAGQGSGTNIGGWSIQEFLAPLRKLQIVVRLLDEYYSLHTDKESAGPLNQV